MLIHRRNGDACRCEGFFAFSKLNPGKCLVKLPNHFIWVIDLISLLADCGSPQPVCEGQRR